MGISFLSQLFLPSSDYPENGSCLFLQQVGVRSLKLRIQERKWNYETWNVASYDDLRMDIDLTREEKGVCGLYRKMWNRGFSALLVAIVS